MSPALRQLAELGYPDLEIQWLVVYIAEAHADDEWPVASARYNRGQEAHVIQTTSISSRIAQALRFYEDFSYTVDNSKWKLLVAPPEEVREDSRVEPYGFESLYKPWPFRAYGFINRTIDFLPEPHACELRIDEITQWLESKRSKFF